MIALGCGFFLLLSAQSAAGQAKFYIRLGDTEEAPGLKSGLVDEAKKLLAEELAKRPEFVVDLPGLPTDPDALAAELERRKLKGYRVFVRLTKVSTEVLPPRTGRRYKQFAATVQGSIIGVTLPGDVMALGGDGESTTATEISGAPKPAEEASLKRSALADALAQAVAKALVKLNQGFQKPPTEKRRKK